MLLCCITLSSSRENQRSAQEVARRFLAPLPGRLTQASQPYQVPITIPISRITLFAICLSFSSPPLHPCRFIRPLSLSSLSFSICLFLHVPRLLVCRIACFSLWLVPYLLRCLPRMKFLILSKGRVKI